MRRQPRIACAVSWVPLSIPIFASQRPVSVGAGGKVGWTVFSLLCTVIALIVWFAAGRRSAYNRPS
ncbi:hypothetical protein ACSMXN_12610 [Jatrophihabitans sp. DSM 45814]